MSEKGIMQTSTSWDGKHILTYEELKQKNRTIHKYMLDDKRVWGATTVGACYPKGEGLIRWMITQGLEEYDKKEKLNKAGAIGRVVHKYAECVMMGQEFDWALVDDSDDANVIRECIRQYDERAAKFPDDKPHAVELLVGSPTLGTASMIDLLKYRDDKLVITDYKTGKKIYIGALHQTILYRRMVKEWLNLDVDMLEILKFSKEPDTIPFETCLVEKDAMVLNGTRFEYVGLMDELEAQTIRNIETHRHVNSVEKILLQYYKEKR